MMIEMNFGKIVLQQNKTYEEQIELGKKLNNIRQLICYVCFVNFNYQLLTFFIQ